MKNLEKRLTDLENKKAPAMIFCIKMKNKKECLESDFNTCYTSKNGQYEYFKRGKKFIFEDDPNNINSIIIDDIGILQ